MSSELLSQEEAVRQVLTRFAEKLKEILTQVEQELEVPQHKAALALKGKLPTLRIQLPGCIYIVTRFPDNGRMELSARQKEVLSLLIHGLARREIAEQLKISARTVDTHFDRLLEKLGVESRVQLIRWADILLS